MYIFYIYTIIYIFVCIYTYMYIHIYIYISSKYIGLPMNLQAWLLASPAFHEVRINDLAAPPDKLDVLAYMERG